MHGGTAAGHTAGQTQAWFDAEEARLRVGVRIRMLETPAEMKRAARVLGTVWPREDEGPPVDGGLLTALAHAGNYVAGTFDGAELVGVCCGFFCDPDSHACIRTSRASSAATRAAGSAQRSSCTSVPGAATLSQRSSRK